MNGNGAAFLPMLSRCSCVFYPHRIRCLLPRTDPHSPARSAAFLSGRERKPGAGGSPGVVGDPRTFLNDWPVAWALNGRSGAQSSWVRNTDRSRACIHPHSSQHFLQTEQGGVAGIQTALLQWAQGWLCVCVHAHVCVVCRHAREQTGQP